MEEEIWREEEEGGRRRSGGRRDWRELSVIPTSSRAQSDIKQRLSSLVLVLMCWVMGINVPYRAHLFFLCDFKMLPRRGMCWVLHPQHS